MNKLFKKTIASLSCVILIGEIMLSNAVVAIEDLVKDLDLNATKKAITSTNFDNELAKDSVSNIITNSINIDFGDSTPDNSDYNTNGSSDEAYSETVKQCDSEIKSAFMNSLSSIINEMLKDNETSNIKRTEVSDDSNTLILYTDNEKAEIPDLTDYIDSLSDYIVGKNNGNDSKYKFRNSLANQNRGLELTVTSITNLVNFNLGTTRQITVNFKDCIFSFELELKVDNSEPDGGNNNNDDNNNNDNNQCNSDIKATFMNSLSDIINGTIKNSNNTDFLRAEASVNDNTIILYVDNENVELPDLNGYISGLVDHILEKEAGNRPEVKFWDNLASKNEGLELSVTDVTNLVDINLGKTNKLYIHFSNCYLTLNLELKVDDSNSGGSNNENYQCSNEIKSNLINTLSESVNDIIKNSNNTGFKRAEASLDDNTLILYVDNKNVQLPDLTGYIFALADYIVGKNGNKIEDNFRRDLASKNNGLDLTVTSVMNLVALNLGERDYVTVYFQNCSFPLYITLKVDTSNGNSGNGHSGGSSSSGGHKSNNEEIILSGEVNDKMEVKKAESCSIEGSIYSDEENQAYLWACEKGITIADNIMKADMNRNLTRAELAKMMSIYSEELLGRDRVKNESITYPDVSDSLGDLAYYIQEGYRLQIMGIHANGSALSKFSPNSQVTRGEFGTVFSRILNGNEYNIESSSYYLKHLDLLKNAEILKNTNPKLVEKRGWILLMLYRSQKVEKSNGKISLEEISNISGENEENNDNTEVEKN